MSPLGFMAITALPLKFRFIQQSSQELTGSNPVVCSRLRRGGVGIAGAGQLPGSRSTGTRKRMVISGGGGVEKGSPFLSWISGRLH